MGVGNVGMEVLKGENYVAFKSFDLCVLLISKSFMLLEAASFYTITSRINHLKLVTHAVLMISVTL